MITCKTKFDHTQKDYYAISQNGQVLTIKYYALKPEAQANDDGTYQNRDYYLVSSTQLDLDERFSAYSGIVLGIDSSNKFTRIVDAEKVFASRSGYDIYLRFFSVTEPHVIQLYFGADANTWVLCTFTPIDTQLAAEYTGKDEMARDAIKRNLPGIEKMYNGWKEANNLLYNFDPNYSLSCLEIQVDLLTQIVKALLQASPSVAASLSAANPNLQQMIDTCMDHSVFTIKSNTQCLDRLGVKAGLREAQKKYYSIFNSAE